MSANTTFEFLDLKKPFLAEVAGDVPSPTYDATGVQTSIPQPTPSPGSRVKTFFLTIYIPWCSQSQHLFSVSVGFPYGEHPQCIQESAAPASSAALSSDRYSSPTDGL